MLFHGSLTGGLNRLEPKTEEESGRTLWFSEKRENVLVYLADPIGRYCRETGFPIRQDRSKFATYGFTPEGLLQFDEYYPDALADTYRGQSGWIYSVKALAHARKGMIRDAVFTTESVPVEGCEFIPDVYEEILRCRDEGKLAIRRYEERSREALKRIEDTIKNEMKNATPAYAHFLRGKFEFLK
ncbi:MAG: hypothetical protein KIG36_03405 [Eubacteriales bacterium]|nr:hypothetical protein [Eubacteriales bacterium]